LSTFLAFFVFLLILFVTGRVSIPKPSSSFQQPIFALLLISSIPQVISVARASTVLLMLFALPSSFLLLISIILVVFLLLPFHQHRLSFELL